ncbi:ABC transporter ATP-binding protein [Nocardioides humi]|uniref:ABC transporter ATP-binding protein n=1 Tax=Nocardioides humi TaxID=449461 RepID=A0ABN2B1W7_9ACTN|nr:ATP-binding cassette domain-containing protein [Nocardioides humi]
MSLSVACSHEYGAGRPALVEVDLTLRAGVTGLLGVNGAGKTTLLRVMSGGLRPSVGDAAVDGTSLYGRRRRQALSRVGYLPQHFDAPRRAKVGDVLRYLGWMRGLDTARARAAADRLLEVVGLADRADAPMGSLSGGMKRRVGFAQSLMADPEVLLLDEPTTGLDPEQRAAMRAVIAAQERAGVTVVSSHLIEDISTLADRLIVLEQGRVLFDDSMEAFRRTAEGTDEERFLRLLTTERRS